MNLEDSLLDTAYAAGVTKQYYELCEKFQFGAGAPYKKVPFKAVLATASGRIDLSKLPGPGTVFQLGGLPAGLSLNFIVQSGGTVETDFCLSVGSETVRSTLALFCNTCLKNQGLPPPSPAYPRPICSSAENMVVVFESLKEIVFLLSEEALKAA